jgi:hypothetical protein
MIQEILAGHALAHILFMYYLAISIQVLASEWWRGYIATAPVVFLEEFDRIATCTNSSALVVK